jgi:hypothetical protein
MSNESFVHGEHNEKACDLLHLNQGFPDWTITTAFYASLHFVTSKIFPFNHPIKDGKSIKFENIAAWQKFKSYGSNKRHELIKDLTGIHCSKVASEYEWLLSASWNARYHNHIHPPEIVNKAISYMKTIKKDCTPATSKN